MSAAARPLPPAAQRLLAVSGAAWGLRPCGRPAPRGAARPAGASSAAELRQWPYWPALPAAAVGWR